VRIVISEPAAEHIRSHGGQVYVWARPVKSCGGQRLVEAALDPPAGGAAFSRFPRGEVAVFIRPSMRRMPDEIRIELGGSRIRRVRASWNGCLYVV
jgi:hypothetical protein